MTRNAPLEQALEWAIAHAEDPDFNLPMVRRSKKGKGRGRSSKGGRSDQLRRRGGRRSSSRSGTAGALSSSSFVVATAAAVAASPTSPVRSMGERGRCERRARSGAAVVAVARAAQRFFAAQLLLLLYGDDEVGQDQDQDQDEEKSEVMDHGVALAVRY